MRTELTVVSIPTPDGTFLARYSEMGLASLDFPAKRDGKANSVKTGVPARFKHWHRTTAAALKCAFLGRNPKALPPLDVSSGTAFQHQVWIALRGIRAGQTRSYGEIARTIGKPKAMRAVGGACGANPIPVLVPCHRVLAANHRIGGFSGGLDWKRKLLEREGVAVVGLRHRET